MRTAFPKPSIAVLALAFAICGQNASSQNSQTQPPPQPANSPQLSIKQQPHHGSPGADFGKGTGDIRKGTAKGAGAAAKGVGKGAGALVTLHPLDAASDVGKGGVVAGKDVGVGAVKGTGKIAKGTGRGIGEIFHHHHQKHTSLVPSEPQN